MREIGVLDDSHQAERFVDYLLTRRIPALIRPTTKGQLAVWVRKEDQLDEARRELERFRLNPDDDLYRQAQVQAASLRAEAERLERDYQRRTNRLDKAMSGQITLRSVPVTSLMMALAIVLGLFNQFGFKDERVEPFLIQSTETINNRKEGGPIALEERLRFHAFADVKQGEIWRLVTPILLHFGPFHLLFNLLWLYDLGGKLERRIKSGQFVLLILVVAVGSNILQYVLGGFNPLFGGLSGVVCGLVGYTWIKSSREPELGLFIHPQTLALVMIYLVVCLTGIFGPVANIAHFAGLGLGALLAQRPGTRIV